MSTVTQKTYPVTPEGTAKLMRLLDDIGIPLPRLRLYVGSECQGSIPFFPCYA